MIDKFLDGGIPLWVYALAFLFMCAAYMLYIWAALPASDAAKDSQHYKNLPIDSDDQNK